MAKKRGRKHSEEQPNKRSRLELTTESVTDYSRPSTSGTQHDPPSSPLRPSNPPHLHDSHTPLQQSTETNLCKTCNLMVSEKEMKEHIFYQIKKSSACILKSINEKAEIHLLHCQNPQCCFATTSSTQYNFHKLLFPKHFPLTGGRVIASVVNKDILDLKALFCVKCHRVFKSSSTLEKHPCGEKLTFKCFGCEEFGFNPSFGTKEEYLDHLQTVHGNPHNLQFWIQTNRFRGRQGGGKIRGEGNWKKSVDSRHLPIWSTYIHVPIKIQPILPTQILTKEILEEVAKAVTADSQYHARPVKVYMGVRIIAAKMSESRNIEYQKVYQKTPPSVILKKEDVSTTLQQHIAKLDHYVAHLSGKSYF